ncbi:hypothetical protein N9Y26_01250 [bacterium]|nr:hypothetical protein [bacterium]
MSLLLDGVVVLEDALKNPKSWMVRVSKYRFNELKETIQSMLKNETCHNLKYKGFAHIKIQHFGFKYVIVFALYQVYFFYLNIYTNKDCKRASTKLSSTDLSS